MTISVVVPCFNEEESIPLFYREMERVRMKMGEKFEYIFINDGSSDGTLSVLRKLHATDSNVHYLSFSRNFGKEAALYAGLERASGEYVTVMDVDLQDPTGVIDRNEAEVGGTAEFRLCRNETRNPGWRTTDSLFLCTDVL